MANDQTEDLFDNAVTHTGDKYVEARDALLAIEPQQEVATYLGLEAASEFWTRALTARIVRGWMTDAAAFEQCARLVAGQLLRPKPMAEFSPAQRAQEIAKLGPAVTPRVIEMLWKTGEHASLTEHATLFEALRELADRSALPLMVDYLENARDPADVKGALSVLSVLEPQAAGGRFGTVAADRSRDDAIRMYAIRSLGKVDDPSASQTLVTILSGDAVDEEERLAAARALRGRSDPATREAVARVLESEFSERVILTLIRLLGDIGSAEDVEQLKRARAISAETRRSADAAIEKIDQRGN